MPRPIPAPPVGLGFFPSLALPSTCCALLAASRLEGRGGDRGTGAFPCDYEGLYHSRHSNILSWCNLVDSLEASGS